MVPSKQIGILIDNSSGWTGGEYYLKNIIKSITFIPESDRPEVFLIYSEENNKAKFVDLEKDLDYVSFYKINASYPKYLVVNKVFLLLNVFFIVRRKIRIPLKLDFVYPSILNTKICGPKKEIFWIPDFQDLYYPKYFGKLEIWRRRFNRSLMCKYKYDLVFSSNNALKDYQNLFPDFKNATHILHFRSILKMPNTNLVTDVLKKYFIDLPYFIVSNQFWKHKNHKILLEAMLLAKRKKINIQLILTGRETDDRNPGYFEELKNFIKINELENSVKSLGFISREDQLQLIMKSIAVIQPSLFEGWNTTVEDCKFLGKKMILSDIAIHREQAEEYKFLFFNPANATDLLNQMQTTLDNNDKINTYIPNQEYNAKIEEFASDFVNM